MVFFFRKIYGDAALGESNLRMIELGRQVNDCQQRDLLKVEFGCAIVS